MGEIVFHIALLAVLGFFYNQTLSIDTTRVTDVVGAAGFPKAIIVLAFILTGISLYKTFRHYSETTRKQHKIEELNIQFIGVLVAVVTFIFATDVIGFVLASIVLSAVIMLLLGLKKISKVAWISVGISSVFTLVFGKILHVPLPRGMGFIQELSFLIY
jgi:hypothetical protein